MSNEKLLQHVRNCIRTQHLSLRTEQAYTTWIDRYLKFHFTSDPYKLKEKHISQYLTSLAVDKQVSAVIISHIHKNTSSPRNRYHVSISLFVDFRKRVLSGQPEA